MRSRIVVDPLHESVFPDDRVFSHDFETSADNLLAKIPASLITGCQVPSKFCAAHDNYVHEYGRWKE